MASNRNHLTSGEVAKMFGVAPRTVVKWHDAGKLSGFRIPGVAQLGGDRRFPLRSVLDFARRNGMPYVLPSRFRGKQDGVFALSADPKVQAITACTTATLADAVWQIAETNPGIILIDRHLYSRFEALSLITLVSREAPSTRLVVLGLEEETVSERDAYAPALVVARPFDPTDLVSLIQRGG